VDVVGDALPVGAYLVEVNGVDTPPSSLAEISEIFAQTAASEAAVLPELEALLAGEGHEELRRRRRRRRSSSDPPQSSRGSLLAFCFLPLVELPGVAGMHPGRRFVLG
jgi:hypothetical protein